MADSPVDRPPAQPHRAAAISVFGSKEQTVNSAWISTSDPDNDSLPLVLTVVEAGDAPCDLQHARFEINDHHCIVGSDQAATLVINQAGLDAQHCEIVRNPAGTFVRNLGDQLSVNGQPLHEAWLNTGDLIRLGDLCLEVHQLGAVTHQPPESGVSSETEQLRIQNAKLKQLIDQLRQIQAADDDREADNVETPSLEATTEIQIQDNNDPQPTEFQLPEANDAESATDQHAQWLNDLYEHATTSPSPSTDSQAVNLVADQPDLERMDFAAADQPAADQTAADQTAADQTAADQTAADQAAADQTAAHQTVADQAATYQAATDQTAADQTAAEQSAADQTAAANSAAPILGATEQFDASPTESPAVPAGPETHFAHDVASPEQVKDEIYNSIQPGFVEPDEPLPVSEIEMTSNTNASDHQDESTDELTAQVPDAQQNESVAEVLARMQQAGKLSEPLPFDLEGQAGSAAEQTPVVAQPPAEMAPQPLATSQPFASSDAPAPAGEASADSTESVQDYMSELFQRLRGDEPATVAAPPAAASVTRPAPAPRPDPENETVDVTSVLKACEYRPSQAAPEKTTTLDALRQVANYSVKSAIQKSNKQKNHQAGLIYGGSAAASLAISIVLFLMSSRAFDLCFMFGILSAIFCSAMGFMFFKLSLSNRTVNFTKFVSSNAKTKTPAKQPADDVESP